jgi:predicted acyl esterase
MEHPNYDEYWQRQNPLKHVNSITHAVLNVGGWFDAEDFYGPLETYRSVERAAPTNKNRIVIGPWLHGGWASMPGDALGDIRFGSPTGEYYRNEIELPFFKQHLKSPDAVVGQTFRSAAADAEATVKPAAMRGRRSTHGRRRRRSHGHCISTPTAGSRLRRRRRGRRPALRILASTSTSRIRRSPCPGVWNRGRRRGTCG